MPEKTTADTAWVSQWWWTHDDNIALVVNAENYSDQLARARTFMADKFHLDHVHINDTDATEFSEETSLFLIELTKEQKTRARYVERNRVGAISPDTDPSKSVRDTGS